MKVTFFGHRDAPQSIRPALQAVLTELIEQHGADTFFVGNQGAFDLTVQSVLRDLKQHYPHIRCFLVLAYMPGKKPVSSSLGEWETLFPETLETIPPRFAIVHRNRWMAEHADTVIAYVCTPGGGAAAAVQFAKKRGKTLLNLATK